MNFQELMEAITAQVRADVEYFNKYKIKSATLSRAQMFLELDNEDFAKACKDLL